MDVALIPPVQVPYVVGAVLPYLVKSEQWTRGRAKVDDILRFVLNGQMQLWVVYEDNTIYGHYITEVKKYPQCQMLVVQYCSGEPHHMETVEEKGFSMLESFAKDASCSGVEFVGRPGWRKAAEKYDYGVQSVMYQKFFEDKP